LKNKNYYNKDDIEKEKKFWHQSKYQKTLPWQPTLPSFRPINHHTLPSNMTYKKNKQHLICKRIIITSHSNPPPKQLKQEK
jgi:hypothetical protein